MAIPEISPLPDVPVRGEPQEEFSVKANAFFAAFPTLRDEINETTEAITEEVNDALQQVADTVAGLTPFGRNLLVNGGFDVWQENTSFTPSSRTYTADMWAAGRQSAVSGMTVSRQTGTTARYALRMQRDSGNTSENTLWVTQVLETPMTIPLRGKMLTLSLKAKAGANFSGGGTITLLIQATTSLDSAVSFSTNGAFSAGSTNLVSQPVTVSTTQSIVSATTSVVVPADTNSLLIRVHYAPTGTAGTNDWLEIEDAQLEVGLAATPFEIRSIALTELMCMRHFEVKTTQVHSNASRHIPLVRKRVTPSVTLTAGGASSITVDGFEATYGGSGAGTANITANARI